MASRDCSLFFLIIAILAFDSSLAQEWRNPAHRPSCVFDDRARSLRCRGTDLRSLRAALREVVGQVDVVEANNCDLRVIPFPMLIGDEGQSTTSGSRDNNISSLAIVNSGLVRMTITCSVTKSLKVCLHYVSKLFHISPMTV